jgi:hypothetical protein
MGIPLDDADAAELLALLLERPLREDRVHELLDLVVARQDVRFVAPLIELVRAGPLQLAEFDDRYTEVLMDLTEVDFRRNWDRWAEWYGNTTLDTLPGFLDWKGQLYAVVDPRLEEFLQGSPPTTIRPELVVWGNIHVDGIRPLDEPPVVGADSPDAAYLAPDEPVIGIVVNGEARAYPVRIMDVHEIVNDSLGSVPITLAYCTLTGAAIAYDGRAPDGQTYTFSSSGFLYENNRLIYDRETGTLWQQILGRPVLGPLVEAAPGGDDAWLDAYPTVVASWEAWRRQHPETTVLALQAELGFGYSAGLPYLVYFNSGDLEYPLTARDLTLAKKRWVYGLDVEGAQRAYAMRDVLSTGVVHDVIGAVDVVVIGQGSSVMVEVHSRLTGEIHFEAGGAVRAYRAPRGVTFSPSAEDGVLLDDSGRRWEVTEEALVGPGGETAPRLVGHLAYWFAWHTFHPETTLWRAP